MLLDARFWKGMQSDHLITILRAALGVIFFIGGSKLAFPTLFGVAGHEALAQGYINPAKGWISPFFAEKITDILGISIASFLQIQGWMEMVMGIVMILGIFTPMVAVTMGLMFWSFTVANPVVGEIRLSRDIALMGLCLAVALSGASSWSLDRKVLNKPFMFAERKDLVLLIARLSLAYTLVASALFPGGVFSNHLNNTLPTLLVFVVGALLAVGVLPRWVMVVVAIWMLTLLPVNIFAKGLFSGLDSTKRELGLLAAALFYFVSGPDRWTWPKPDRLLCRNIVDLVINYVEGTLDRPVRQAFESHIADCTNCWQFLTSYRDTMDLGQSLQREDIPPDVRTRLDQFMQSHLQP
ncbi:MAG: hypothetical protein GTO40_02945 [Deltaproteobacteria bacterium]|nr:hypothetical protein [Deltaproteobacteria bacterium]